jgi:hypothetical protein
VEAARRALRRARGNADDDDGGDDLYMLLDWRLMQRRADSLLISNSTFSFTAAWLSCLPGGKGGDSGNSNNRLRRLFRRPCPQARAFVPFDPWDSPPLLPSRADLPANHGAHQHRARERQRQEEQE